MACEKSVLAYFIKCGHVRPEFLKLILPNNNSPELLDFIGKKKKKSRGGFPASNHGEAKIL